MSGQQNKKKVLISKSSKGWSVTSMTVNRSVPRDVHVLPSEGGWTVRREGASRAAKRFPTRGAAISWARKSAKKDSTDLVVHGSDGRIRSKDSYGTDPLPPKDKPQ